MVMLAYQEGNQRVVTRDHHHSIPLQGSGAPSEAEMPELGLKDRLQATCPPVGTPRTEDDS